MPAVAVDQYFRRIGWSGTAAPNLSTLTGLMQCHTRSVPFENLDVLLGRGIRIDLNSVEDKLVTRRRGGYCFEQATLFAAVLEALGFKVTRHTARVVLFVPRDASPRTHMFLIVEVPEGRFVVDPGFGALVPRRPLPLVSGERVSVGAEAHWLDRAGAHWILRAEVDGRIQDCWATALDPDNEVDFVVGNHFTSTYPESPFLNRLMMRALTDDGRITVMNRDVTVRRGSTVETFQLTDRRALRLLLADSFGIDLPEAESIRIPTVPEWT